MYTPSINFTCPQCGRDVFTVFACPERKAGGCPFVKRWSGGQAHLSFNMITVLGFAGLMLAGVFQTAWLILVPAALGALLWLLVRNVQFYNPASGIMIERTQLAGLQTSVRVMKKDPALSVPLKPARPLHYPLSIATLGDRARTPEEDRSRAICVFRAALVDLLVKDLIEIEPVRSYEPGADRTERVQGIEHAIVDKSRGWPRSEVEGLEGDILRAIGNEGWKVSGREAWLDGPRLYELVRAYYGTDVPSPQVTLLNSVERNAAAFGLCEIQTAAFWGYRKDAVWGGPHIDELQADCRTADDLAQQFQSMCPDVWDGLYQQISKAMTSRERTDTD